MNSRVRGSFFFLLVKLYNYSLLELTSTEVFTITINSCNKPPREIIPQKLPACAGVISAQVIMTPVISLMNTTLVSRESVNTQVNSPPSTRTHLRADDWKQSKSIRREKGNKFNNVNDELCESSVPKMDADRWARAFSKHRGNHAIVPLRHGPMEWLKREAATKFLSYQSGLIAASVTFPARH